MIEGKVVLTGASGILGSTFARLIPRESLVTLGRCELDPADPASVQRLIVDLAPSLIINCAADTDVEGAETQQERAFAVNATLAAAVARAGAEIGASMLHFSSTGCYGDWKTTPYEETDPLRPTTAHHRSKALGEEQVLRAHPSALVLRLGWLFGGRPGQRKNFVWARLAEAKVKNKIGSDPKQIGCPTSAEEVAQVAFTLIKGGASGVFNCVGAGPPARRIDYVTAILAAVSSSAQIIPVAFKRQAPVSSNESALNTQLRKLGIEQMSPWRDSLINYVHLLESGAYAEIGRAI